MSILDILKGRERKFWKLEDRINKVNEQIDSNKYLSIDELNSLSNGIANLKYNLYKGSFKKVIQDNNRNLNYNDVTSLISKIENYRNQKYNIEINDNKYVYEINEIYNNKKLNGNKFYYLNDRLSEVEKRIDKIDTNNCSLKDIDSLNYILISMEKDSYMKRKAKKDKNFNYLKNKVENKIKNVITKTQNNLNNYTISYHLNEKEIDEAKKNKVTIDRKKNSINNNFYVQSLNFNENKKENNYIKKIANKIDENYDYQISLSLGKMAKWLKYSMIGVLGLCAYEIGSSFFNDTPNNIIIEEIKQSSNNELLILDDFSNNYKQKIDSILNDLANDIKKD